MPAESGRYPSGPRGQTVNLLAYAFGGSNPPLPTIVTRAAWPARLVGGLSRARILAVRVAVRAGGNSSAVERQPSKLGVAGSNPVSRSIVTSAAVTRAAWPARLVGGLSPARVGRARVAEFAYAHVAQTAERVLGKDEVSGSIPDMGSSSEGRRRVVTANGRT